MCVCQTRKERERESEACGGGGCRELHSSGIGVFTHSKWKWHSSDLWAAAYEQSEGAVKILLQKWQSTSPVPSLDMAGKWRAVTCWSRHYKWGDYHDNKPQLDTLHTLKIFWHCPLLSAQPHTDSRRWHWERAPPPKKNRKRNGTPSCVRIPNKISNQALQNNFSLSASTLLLWYYARSFWTLGFGSGAACSRLHLRPC